MKKMIMMRQGAISLSGRSQPHCVRGVSPNLMLWYNRNPPPMLMMMTDGDDDDDDDDDDIMKRMMILRQGAISLSASL